MAKTNYAQIWIRNGPLGDIKITNDGTGIIRLNMRPKEGEVISYPVGVDEADRIAEAMLNAVKLERRWRKQEDGGDS